MRVRLRFGVVVVGFASGLLALLQIDCGGGGRAGFTTDGGGGGVTDGGTADAGMNRPPVARPGDDRSGDVFEEVALDGTQSFDPDGESLTGYTWILIERPNASTAEVRDSDRARAFLRPDVRGVYRIGLVVFSSQASDRAELRLTVSDECCRPIANAGPDRDVVLGEEAQLDGTGSSDPNNQALRFIWALVDKPPASVPTLADADRPTARFRPDPALAHARYELTLAVLDTTGLASALDHVIVNVRNSAPVVSIGDNRTIVPGARLTLSATATDLDGDALTYDWRIISQPGSDAALTARASAPHEAVFVAELGRIGNYVIECLVEDGHGGATAARVTLSSANEPPAVRAGDSQTAGHDCDAAGVCSAAIDLAGTATDPEGDPLTIEWSAPTGGTGRGAVTFTSTSTLSTRATIRANDGHVIGTYPLQLCAKDAFHDPVCSSLVLTLTNRAPTANVAMLDAVNHDAAPISGGGTRYRATFRLQSLAEDPDFAGNDAGGAHLRYLWTAPGPSELPDPAVTIQVSNATNRATDVTVTKDCTGTLCDAGAGLLGFYTFHVEVKDPNDATTQGSVTVEIDNREPTLTLSPASQGVAPGATAQINATALDADGDPLRYEWALEPGTGGTLTTNGPVAVLQTATQLVTHVVRLTVTDAFGASVSKTAQVVTNEAPVVSPIAPQSIGHACTVTAGVATCTASVALSGSATDNDTLTYSWPDFTKPGNRALVTASLSGNENSTSRTLTLTSGADGALSGTYGLQFCAQDPFNVPVCTPIQVTVTNRGPEAVNAGANQNALHTAEPGNSRRFRAAFQLTGSANDPDFGSTPFTQQKLTYSWTNPAPSEIVFDTSARTPSVAASKDCTTPCAAPVMGPYTFTLTVTDPNGASATATTTVTITNTKPTVTVTPQSSNVEEGALVALTADGQDANDDRLDYVWDFSALPPSMIAGSTGGTATVLTAAGVRGVFAVSVRVFDGWEQSDSASATIRVNSPPTVSAPAAQPAMGHTCQNNGFCSATSTTLTAGATDPDPGDEAALTYRWRAVPVPAAGGPLTISFSDPNAKNPTVTVSHANGAIAGAYTLLFCAYDALHPKPAGEDSTYAEQCAATNITITNQAPTAVAASPGNVAHQAIGGQENYEATFTLMGSGRDMEFNSGATEPGYLGYQWKVVSKADSNATVVFTDTNTTTSTAKNPSVKVSRNCTLGGCPARPYPAGTVLLSDSLQGNYGFELVVVDPSGLASTAVGTTVTVTNAAPGNAPQGGPAPGLLAHTYVGSGGNHLYQAQAAVSAMPGADAAGDPLQHEWFLGTPIRGTTCVYDGTQCVSALTAPLSTTITLRGDANLITGVSASHLLCVRARDPWGELSSANCILVQVKNDAPAAPSLGFGSPGETFNNGHQYQTMAATYASTINNVTATGVSSDVEGDPITYTWSAFEAQSPGVVFSFPNPALSTGNLVLSAGTGTNLVGKLHTVCLQAQDSLGATASSCRDIFVTNSAPSASSAGFSNNLSVAHTDGGSTYSATVSGVAPGAHSDADSDPTGSPAYRWLVTNTAEVTASGPAPGTLGNLVLSSTNAGAFIGPTLRVCLETKDTFGATSPLTDGSSCRNVTVTNAAPTLSGASATQTAALIRKRLLQPSCGCSSTKCVNGSVSLTATPADTNGGSITLTWTNTSQPLAGCVPATTTRSCTAGSSCSSSVSIASVSCVGTYTWSVQATDPLGATSSTTMGISVTPTSVCASVGDSCDEC